jgi:hypothetical protein
MPGEFKAQLFNCQCSNQRAAREMNADKNRIYRLELALPKQSYLATYPQNL